MRSAIKIVLSLIITTSLFIGCQKDKTIIIKTLPYDSQLSVECLLYPGKVPKLFLSMSVPFFNAQTSPSDLFVKNASVKISSSSSTDILQMDSSYDNYNCRWVPFYKGSIAALYGETYNLSINFKGNTINASTTIGQPKVNISTIDYIAQFQDLYGEHEGIVVNFNDAANSKNYYRFQMDRIIDTTLCGAIVPPFQVTEIGRSVYTDNNIDGQAIKIVIEPSYKHKQNDSAYIFIESMDEASGSFYDNLDKQQQAQLNPFIEPVFLKSNINGGVGVFGSVVLSDSVLFIFPE